MNDTNSSAESIEQVVTNSGESVEVVEQDSAPSFSSGFTLVELSGLLALGVPALCLLLALIEGSSYIWRPIAVVLYVALLLFGILLIAFARLPSDAIEKYGAYELDAAFTLLGTIAVLVAFSQVGRHLYLLIGGFLSEQAGYWHWLRFGFSNLLESVLFDIPAIYDWNISEIRATSTWSRTIVFLFRTTIEFLVVATVLRQAGVAWKKRDSVLRNPPRNYFALIIPKAGELILMVLWGLPIAIGIGAVVNDGLSLQSTWSVIRLGIPVAFGIWLAWHSLRGLGLPNVRNKLFALAGIVGGVWLVRENWPAFRAFLDQ